MKVFRFAMVTLAALLVWFLPTDGSVEPSLMAVSEPSTTTTAAETTTTVPATTTTVAWYDEPHCDGKPCGTEADAPADVIVCPDRNPEGDNPYSAGTKQLDGQCPPFAEPTSDCPPDEWRRGDVRVDYAAQADGCGPLVGEW